jgi:CRP-like cAMP-binding protein
VCVCVCVSFFFFSSSSFSASRAQFFLRKPMHFSLIAAQDMEVIEFSRAQFLVMEKEAPEIAERIMTHVMEKVRVQYATDGAWTALHCTALHRAALRSYVTNLSRSLCSSMDLLDSLVILARHMHIMYTYVDAAKHAHLMSLLLF